MNQQLCSASKRTDLLFATVNYLFRTETLLPLTLAAIMSERKGDVVIRKVFAVIRAMKGARMFVCVCMRNLQRKVKDDLVAQGKDIDCSGCSAFDVGPMQLSVTSLSPDGVFTTDVPHFFEQAKPYRVKSPIPVTFSNVPPSLQAAGIAEDVTM